MPNSFGINCGTKYVDDLRSLHQKLLCGYDKTQRPVLDHKKPVEVSVKMLLKAFDIVLDIFKIYTTIKLSWTDEHLTWEKVEYGGLSEVYIGSKFLWIPDYTVFNGPNGKSTRSPAVACKINYKGLVYCELPVTFNANCDASFEQWPYDNRTCYVYFGSFITPGEQIMFSGKNFDVFTASMSTIKSQWKLNSGSGKKVIRYFRNETFPIILYKFNFERHAKSLAIYHVFPAIIIAFINLVVFYVNRNDCQPFYLLFVTMIGNIIMLFNIPYMIDKSGDSFPNMLLLCRNSMVLTLFILIETATVQSLANYSSGLKEMGWIQKICQKLNIDQRIGVFKSLSSRSRSHERTNEEIEVGENSGSIRVPAVSSKNSLLLVVDRVSFIFCLIFYSYCFYKLLPKKYVTG